MSREYFKRRQRQRGSAMLELAVCSFLLLYILTGIIEFSRAFYTADVVVNAARAGAAYGSQSQALSKDYSGMQTAAINDAGSASVVSATASQYCECPGSHTSVDCSTIVCSGKLKYVKVTSTASYSTLGSYSWIPNPMTVSSTAYVRVK